MNRTEVIALLWQRIDERGEFPMLKRSLNSVVSVMHDEAASRMDLTAIILSDFTLTQRVLRLANSAMYSPYGRNVTTVSRALMILGTGTVAHLAIGMQLMESFDGLVDSSAEASGQLWQVSFAGKLAREIAIKSGERFGEEAVVATLIAQLGRLLTVFYLPEQWGAIAELIANGVQEEEAFRTTLGMSATELSSAAIKKWDLPLEPVAIVVPETSGEDVVATHTNWLGCIAGLATNLSAVLFSDARNRIDHAAIHELVEAYAGPLGIAQAELEDKMLSMFQEEQPPQEISEFQAPSPNAGKPLDAADRLGAGLLEIQSEANRIDGKAMVHMVIDSMINSLGLKSCAMFVRNVHTQIYDAQVALGFAKNGLEHLSFEEAFVPDVFHLALSQGRPLFIADITDARIATKIPGWHRHEFPKVRSIVLIPVYANNRTVGLLYGNWGDVLCADGISAQEIKHLNSMRVLIARAFERSTSHTGGGMFE